MARRRKGRGKYNMPLTGSRRQEKSGAGRGHALVPLGTDGDDHSSCWIRDGDARGSIDGCQGADNRDRASGEPHSASVPGSHVYPITAGLDGGSVTDDDTTRVGHRRQEFPRSSSIGPMGGDSEGPHLSDGRGFYSDFSVAHGPSTVVPGLILDPRLLAEDAGQRPQTVFGAENPMVVPTGHRAWEDTSGFQERRIHETEPSGAERYEEFPPSSYNRERSPPEDQGFQPRHRPTPYHSYRGPNPHHSPLRRASSNKKGYDICSDDDDEDLFPGSHHGRHLGQESRYLTGTHTGDYFTGDGNMTRGTSRTLFNSPGPSLPHGEYHPTTSSDPFLYHTRPQEPRRPRPRSPRDPGNAPRGSAEGYFGGDQDMAPRTPRRRVHSQGPSSANGDRHSIISDSHHPYHPPSWEPTGDDFMILDHDPRSLGGGGYSGTG